MDVPLFNDALIRQETVGLSGPRNMAIDEALLRENGESHSPILRFYAWEQPSVSFGYFEAVAASIHSQPCVRRWDGRRTGAARFFLGEFYLHNCGPPKAPVFRRETVAKLPLHTRCSRNYPESGWCSSNNLPRATTTAWRSLL